MREQFLRLYHPRLRIERFLGEFGSLASKTVRRHQRHPEERAGVGLLDSERFLEQLARLFVVLVEGLEQHAAPTHLEVRVLRVALLGSLELQIGLLEVGHAVVTFGAQKRIGFSRQL